MFTIKQEQKVNKVAREVRVGESIQVVLNNPVVLGTRYRFEKVASVKRLGKMIYIKTVSGKEIEVEHWMRVVVKIEYEVCV